MNNAITTYNNTQSASDQRICELLMRHITNELPDAEAKIWHRHPVWFLSGNPIVGYSKQKAGIRLMFWSGADFDEEALSVRGEKFKDASIFYSEAADIVTADLTRWLKKSRTIQWDYQHIVQRKGKLVRIS